MATKIPTTTKTLLLMCFWTLSANFINQVASQSHNCTHVNCPPMSEITCPEDSYVREFNQESNLLSTPDYQVIVEEVFVHCCVTQKCSCSVCHIPSCHNTSLVLMETKPETETPGKCCGQYECIYEPNCNVTINSNGHWLTDCQRCSCVSGERFCHRSCDEIMMPPGNCISPNLNRFFGNGDTWNEDDCTHCECLNGYKNCQVSSCRPMHCKNKLKIPGQCCPICEEETELDDINNVYPPTMNNVTISTKRTTTTSTTTTTTPSPTTAAAATSATNSPTATTAAPLPPIVELPPPVIKLQNEEVTITESTTSTPATTQPSATMILYKQHDPDTKAQDTQPPTLQYTIFFLVITVILSVLILFIRLYCRAKAKLRSYEIVSTDDNCNQIVPTVVPIETA